MFDRKHRCSTLRHGLVQTAGWPRLVPAAYQAIYQHGTLQILELRREAESALGNGFDSREFHRAVLEDGALTLPVLNQKIKIWTSGQNGKHIAPTPPSG